LLITSSGAARVWPHKGGADGFFIAAFERQSEVAFACEG
jgi:16S rRNA C967 or C1407 C5-methylase (RsmB/RsmF family)